MKPQKTTKTPQKPKRRPKNDRKKTHTKTSMLQNITKPKVGLSPLSSRLLCYRKGNMSCSSAGNKREGQVGAEVSLAIRKRERFCG